MVQKCLPLIPISLSFKFEKKSIMFEVRYDEIRIMSDELKLGEGGGGGGGGRSFHLRLRISLG